jgi:hypothetical protein
MLTKIKLFFKRPHHKNFLSHKFLNFGGPAWHFPKMDIYKCPIFIFGFSNGGKNREIFPLLEKRSKIL